MQTPLRIPDEHRISGLYGGGPEIHHEPIPRIEPRDGAAT